ncbi:MAG TPA: MFS transporter [Bryobacteraceae bacterium]|nr:MFS transporter [Bryobacteraceae bacterium]
MAAPIRSAGPVPLYSPTRARHLGVLFASALAFVAYVDRACIGQAGPFIVRELHLSPFQMGDVSSAFGLSCAAFEISSGWLCDRIDTRLVLSRVVLCWSFFTAVTGWCFSFPSLQATRFLSGAMNTLGHVGSVAPTVIGYLPTLSGNNWPLAFYASAVLSAAGGLCWIVLDSVTPLAAPRRSGFRHHA